MHDATLTTTTMKTIAQSTIALCGLASIQASAEKNGMTVNQVAAAQYIQSGGIPAMLSAEAKSVLVSRDTALAALARIADVPMLDETHAARVARIQSAILA